MATAGASYLALEFSDTDYRPVLVVKSGALVATWYDDAEVFRMR